MENSDSRNASGAGGRASSKPKWFVLGGLLAVLAVVCTAYTVPHLHKAKLQKTESHDGYASFMAAVAVADVVADPLQRCLSYPDLPGTHWDAATTRAYCVYRNHATIALADIDALLSHGKAGEVDRVFQGYLDTQRHDPAQAGLLDIAFAHAGFGDSDQNTRRIIDMWKQQSPNSGFAFAASGMQYVAAAHEARGEGWSRDLTDKQVAGMTQQLALAFKDLARSIALDASDTAIFPSLMHASALIGNGRYMAEAARMGLEADPSNFSLRSRMMFYGQPRWGANFGGVVEQSRKDVLLASKNPLLRMLAQRPAVYRATCDCGDTPGQIQQRVGQAIDKNVTATDLAALAAMVYDSNRRLAVELYSEALRFAPADDVDVLRWRSQAMIGLGDKPGAMASFAAVARRFPQNDVIATQLGNIYAQAGDAKHAEATLLAVLARDPHNYQAMGLLGDLYNHAGHQPQKAEALADTMIREHPERAGGYIVRSCNQMDHNLPGVYDTIHYFIEHFGNDPQWKAQAAEMRAYLAKHPEKSGA